MEQIYFEEGQRYIIPTSDWGFKRLFGTELNKKLLIGFLNEVIDDCVIEDLEYLDRDVLVPVGSVRRMSFDVYCKCTDGSRVIVEMQNYAKTSFVNRALVYTAASILENYSYSKREDYRIQKTYMIAITGEKLFPKIEHSPVRLGLCDLDSPKTTVLNDRILQIFIELPKFADDVKEIDTNDRFLDKFSVAMKKMATFEKVPEAMNEALFAELFAAADIRSLNTSDREEYLKSVMNEFEYTETLKDYRDEGLQEGREEGRLLGLQQGREEGLQQGIQEGIQQGIQQGLQQGRDEEKRAIIQRLKQRGFSEKEISEILKG